MRRTMAPTSLLSLLLLAAASFPISRAYPAYDDPIQATPPVVRPGQLLCTVDLVRNAACDAYGKVTTQHFPVPADVPGCRGWVSKVVLDMEGSVKGVQFDRYGGVFLGDVELLRTTTPEPSPQGIAWQVEKDVSDYLSYILDASVPKNGTVSITNIVDSTYTGVIYINATLSFYGRPFSTPASSPATLLRGRAGNSSNATDKKQLLPSPAFGEEDTGLVPERGASPPLVLPLVFPNVSSTGEWSQPTLSGEDDSINVPLPPWPQPNIARAFLDLVATPHGCEEFFYTNVPTDEAANLGSSCGGGSYRELQVFVDGKLAGAVYPFVVLYTGGVNPFLWRPLTGIESFDIPAYRYDLTPFVGLFNTVAVRGVEAPVISLKAYGNNEEGIWAVSSALLLHPEPSLDATVVLAGSLDSATDSGAQVSVEKKTDDPNVTTFKTVGYHAFSVTGSLVYPNGTYSTTTTVAAHLSSWNENSVIGDNSQRTRGSMADVTTIERHGSDGALLGQRRHKNQYPFFIQSYYGNDSQSMELRATVDIALERGYDEETSGRLPFAATWTNRIKSHAVYNRSLVDHSHPNTMVGESSETFRLFSSLLPGKDPCYDRQLSASEGQIHQNRSSYACLFPPGLTFCGYHVCPQLGAEGVLPDKLAGGRLVATTMLATRGNEADKATTVTSEPQLSLRAKAALEGGAAPTLMALRERVRGPQNVTEKSK